LVDSDLDLDWDFVFDLDCDDLRFGEEVGFSF
jgi:hypothetical protein